MTRRTGAEEGKVVDKFLEMNIILEKGPKNFFENLKSINKAWFCLQTKLWDYFYTALKNNWVEKNILNIAKLGQIYYNFMNQNGNLSNYLSSFFIFKFLEYSFMISPR